MDDPLARLRALSDASLDAWAEQLHRGRPEFLAALRDLGLPLRERQACANALGRLRRASSQSPPAETSPPLPSLPLPSLPLPSAPLPSAPAARPAGALLVSADAGLCNKLRVCLSYRAIAAAAGRRLVVLWRLSHHCAARFPDLLAPLDGVDVVHDAEELQRLHAAASFALRLAPQLSGACTECHPSLRGTAAERQMFLALSPLPHIQQRIDALRRRLGAPFVAVHVRRTDHAKCFGVQCSDEQFAAFLERCVAQVEGCRIFLATDNAETQQEFLRRYGERVYVSEPISHAHALRQTSVATALVDLYTCAAACRFKGTPRSSFSDTILQLRQAKGTASIDDEHTVVRMGDNTDCSVDLDAVTEQVLTAAGLQHLMNADHQT
ncbi:hypothetical protein AB1Y20_012861 [Prymnesium parvum]|uniref:GDP-fucose protein O-fucosyltransferase 1 n=1 Tax=Prymnesium parvum TaxID=97485 RepID=A0AB34ILY7_PRYPA